MPHHNSDFIVGFFIHLKVKPSISSLNRWLWAFSRLKKTPWRGIMHKFHRCLHFKSLYYVDYEGNHEYKRSSYRHCIILEVACLPWNPREKKLFDFQILHEGWVWNYEIIWIWTLVIHLYFLVYRAINMNCDSLVSIFISKQSKISWVHQSCLVWLNFSRIRAIWG